MKLSARYEIRVNGRSNRARFTATAALRIALRYRANGSSAKIIEHS